MMRGFGIAVVVPLAVGVLLARPTDSQRPTNVTYDYEYPAASVVGFDFYSYNLTKETGIWVRIVADERQSNHKLLAEPLDTFDTIRCDFGAELRDGVFTIGLASNSSLSRCDMRFLITVGKAAMAIEEHLTMTFEMMEGELNYEYNETAKFQPTNGPYFTTTQLKADGIRFVNAIEIAPDAVALDAVNFVKAETRDVFQLEVLHAAASMVYHVVVTDRDCPSSLCEVGVSKPPMKVILGSGSLEERFATDLLTKIYYDGAKPTSENYINHANTSMLADATYVINWNDTSGTAKYDLTVGSANLTSHLVQTDRPMYDTPWLQHSGTHRSVGSLFVALASVFAAMS